MNTEEDIKKEIFIDYSNGMSGNKIIKKYKTSHKTINKIVNSFGGDYKTSEHHQDNIVHDSFQNIDSEETAYFLGLLLADGSISRKQNLITLSLQEEDGYLVESFKSLMVKNPDLGPPIFLKSQKIKNRKDFYRFSISSRKAIKNLNKFGMHSLKDFSANIELDKIPENLHRHVLRGVFDGDGCACLNSKKSGGLRIDITTASEKMKESVIKILDKNDINPTVFHSLRSNGAYSIQIKFHEDVLKFFNLIYGNSTIFMKRKFLKFTAGFKSKEKYILNKTKDQKDGIFIGIDKLVSSGLYRVTYNSKRCGTLFENKIDAALFLNQHKLKHSRYKAPQDLNWPNYTDLEQLISPSRIIRDLNITLDKELKQVLENNYNIKT